MYNVRIRKCDGNKIVHMGGEASKARLVPHESVKIHKQDSSQI
jgi:hypothetical protein